MNTEAGSGSKISMASEPTRWGARLYSGVEIVVEGEEEGSKKAGSQQQGVRSSRTGLLDVRHSLVSTVSVLTSGLPCFS